MKKHHILYDGLIDVLKHVGDSPTTDQFAETAEATTDINAYADYTGKLRTFHAAVVKAKSDRSFDVPFGEILSTFEIFCGKFPNYPSLNRAKFGLLVTVAEKIAGEGVPMDEKEIQDSAFTLIQLPESTHPTLYSFPNQTAPLDSVISFNTVDLKKLRDEMLTTAHPISLEMLYHLLIQITQQSFSQPGTYAMIKKVSPAISPSAALAFIRLSIVADGKAIHRSRDYLLAPNVAKRDSITPTLDYQQHSDVIEVLSEYNTRRDVLTKYLTLYHAFENFMGKLPIVDLERQHSGKKISLRDFRSLSTRLLGPENESLERFFKRMATEKPDLSNEFATELFGRWTAYFSAVGSVEADKVLLGLNLKNDSGSSLKSSEVVDTSIHRFFPKFVYQLRNAIVHNKEVDVHITCASMSDALERFLADIMIPSLERLCFHLLSSKNDHVWYESENLMLFKKGS